MGFSGAEISILRGEPSTLSINPGMPFFFELHRDDFRKLDPVPDSSECRFDDDVVDPPSDRVGVTALPMRSPFEKLALWRSDGVSMRGSVTLCLSGGGCCGE